MKTIAVVGVGTVGILSLAHYLNYLPDDWKVVSIHDPKLPIFGIGESTPVPHPTLFYEAAGYSIFENSDELDATVKLGIKYVNWREHDIFSHVQPPAYGMHLNNFKIKEVFLKRFKQKWKNKFESIEMTIESITNKQSSVQVVGDGKFYNYDYLVDCRGWPENYDDCNLSETSTVNHCLVTQIKKPGDWNFTYHVAHENGWMFGIPLKTRQGWGYLYNDTITTKEDALKDFAKIMKVDIEDLEYNEFSWKNFYTKKILDGRIIKNGNRAMFLEPLEGFAGAYYAQVNRAFMDYMFGIMTEEHVNRYMFESAQDVEAMVAYIYHGGSTFDSEFWKTTKEKTSKYIKNNIRFNDYIYKIRSMDRIQKLTSNFTPLSVNLWENHDRGFGYHYFTPKD